MRCSACSTAIEADDRFCCGCGAPIRLTACPGCGHANRPQAAFCGQCGHSLRPASAPLPPPSPPESPAEALKYVSLLRADLVGSTQLVAGLGPEAVVERLEAPMVAMRQAVHQFGGIVVKELGDGLFAAFGAPVADDNHAVLVCHAAMDLLQRIDALGDPALRVRVGVHSGYVVASMVRGDLASVYELGGPALILVERLQAAAEPGRAFASEACRVLAEGHIRFDTLPPQPLKGFAHPVPVNRIAGAGDPSSWRVRAARSLSHFVGRDSEITGLTQAAEAAARGRGEAIALIGEAGIGKSRLVHEFLDACRRTGWQVLEAECGPTTEASPYALLKSVLNGLPMPVQEAGDPSETLPPLWQAALASVLDREVSDRAWAELDPALRGRAIAEACWASVETILAGRRTILAIEDVHWIDKSSAAVIEGLIALARRHPLLLMFTSRPLGLPSWIGTGAVRLLPLAPLDRDAAASLLGDYLGGAPNLSALKQRLLDHTGGVPLFIEAVCRQLIERDALRPDQGTFVAGKSLSELGVPPTVQGVIAARVDRLAKAERRLLQIAAAIGPRTDAGLLQVVADLPEPILRTQLSALEAAGLLGMASLLPERRYAFPHDLIRQVAYESMLERTRIPLHQQILAALEAAAEDDAEDQAALLCHHAAKAEDWLKTYRYAHGIARKCVARSALADATAYFETALDAVDRLPDTREREAQAIDLRLEARLAFSGFGQVDRWLELAREAEARAANIDDAERRVVAMAVRAAALNFYGPPIEAINVGRTVLEQAETLEDPSWLGYAAYGLGQAYFVAGRCREAEGMLGRAILQLSDPRAIAPIGTTAQNLLFLCRMMKCAAHLGLGEIETAALLQGKVAEAATASARPADRVASGYSGGMLLLSCGKANEAAETLERTLALAKQHEVRLFIPVVACQLGLAYLELRLVAAACAALTEAREEAKRAGHVSALLRASAYLALALCRCGDETAALDLARRTRDSARQQGFEAIEAEALYAEAETMAAASNPDIITINTVLRAGTEIAQRLEAQPLIAKAVSLQNLLRTEQVRAAPHGHNLAGEQSTQKPPLSLHNSLY
jgi:class 3 adenylate cyclase/tetratricopeptide (TPR) repeat protein